MRALPAVAALLFAALAGCAKPAETTTLSLAGSHGFFAQGMAYDGQGVVPMSEGFIVIEADNATNEGAAHAEAVVNGAHYSFRFTKFFEAPGKTFQDGGIRFGFQEHGTTQVGDTSIPEVHAIAAAWGDGTVELNGTPFLDLTTGSDVFSFHYMVVSTGIRDDETRAVFADASRTTFYDPAAPTPGNPVKGDHEIMLVVKSKGADGIDGGVLLSGAVLHPQYAFSDTFDVEVPYSSLALDFTITSDRPVVAPYELTLLLRDPSNKVLRSRTFSGEGGPFEPVVHPIRLPANKTGAYKVDVTGFGADIEWALSGPVLAPKVATFNLWWEDVLLHDAAKAFGATATVTAKHEHDHSDM